MTDRVQALQRLFFVGLTLFVAGVLGITAYTVWRLHTEAIAQGLEASTTNARGLEDFLTQGLHAAELSAINVVPPRQTASDLRAFESSAAATLRHTPFLRSLSWLDDSGRIVASSNPASVGKWVAVDSYLPHTNGRLEMLRVGAPWSGRDFADGTASTASSPVAPDAQSFIPLTRTTLVDDHPVTLLMAFNSDYFLNHVTQILDAEEGSVEVLRYDGTVLMDSKADASIGAVHEQWVGSLRLSEVESGRFEQDHAQSGAVLTAYRASHLYPLVVFTHRQRNFALKRWASEAPTLLGVVLPSLLMSMLLAITVFRRQSRFVRQEAEAERLRRINATVFDVSSDAIVITDTDANIISVNPAFTRITGYSAAEVIGRNPRLLASGQQDKAFYLNMWQTILRDGVWQGELVNRNKDGSFYECQSTITATYDGKGRLQHFIGDITDISERKQAQKQISELNRDFVAFLENTSDFIYFKDEHSRFRFCSQTLARITGHAHWRDMLGKHDSEVFPKETADIYIAEELPIFRDAVSLMNKIDPYFDRHGNPGWVSTNKWPVLDAQGKVVGLFGISRDITERMTAEKKLLLAASVFANSREAIMITTTDGAIVDVNQAFTRITGYARDEVVGKNPRVLKSGRQSREHYATMWASLIEKGHWYGEVWNRRKNGEVFAVMQTISSVRDDNGVAQHFVSLFSDITPLKEHQLQLEHIAHFDALTSLPNRVLLADRLRQGMTQALRRGQLLAVAFLDLDGFKGINDKHGHEAGDQLLITLALRMKEALREGDTLARMGGDEFVAVLVDLGDVAVCLPMLNRLLEAAAQPVAFGSVSLQVSASLGVTFFPQTEEVDADQLLRQADQAMYQAKMAGKNRYQVFDAEQDRSMRGHHESLENIRAALLKREFVLHYQPKVNMRTAQFVGAEALIRWLHPQKGLVYPAEFLPVIEDHALAVEIGEWVIESALMQMAQWHAQGLDIAVSVNVGARQLQQVDFVPRLQAALGRYPGITPRDLQLEILETSALDDFAQVSRVMEDCARMGVSFAIDDFGTGYSSLTYLKRLRVKLLKIDRSFVCNMHDDADDLAILKSVISLASAFHCGVIAEGVETVAHGSSLLRMGCELAQGYGIAQPMPPDQMPGWVAAWRHDPIRFC